MAERLIEVKDLEVKFHTEDGVVNAVDGVSFELQRGQVLGIVGESGSGKSVTAMTLLGLTRDSNTTFGGEVLYKGRNVLEMNEDELQDVRGNEMSMIFQDPMTSLNPVYTIGTQISEAIRVHQRADKKAGARAHNRPAEAGRHSECGVARRQLSTRVFGRDAPARDDRDGTRVQP